MCLLILWASVHLHPHQTPAGQYTRSDALGLLFTYIIIIISEHKMGMYILTVTELVQGLLTFLFWKKLFFHFQI